MYLWRPAKRRITTLDAHTHTHAQHDPGKKRESAGTRGTDATKRGRVRVLRGSRRNGATAARTKDRCRFAFAFGFVGATRRGFSLERADRGNAGMSNAPPLRPFQTIHNLIQSLGYLSTFGRWRSNIFFQLFAWRTHIACLYMNSFKFIVKLIIKNMNKLLTIC